MSNTEKDKTTSDTKKSTVKNNLVEAIGELTVKELLELVEGIEEKFKIDKTQSMRMGSGPVESEVEEAPVVDVNKKVNILLTGLGTASQLQYIKAAKEFLGSTIEEAKNHVAATTEGKSSVIKGDITRAEAEELMKKINTSTPGLVLEIK